MTGSINRRQIMHQMLYDMQKQAYFAQTSGDRRYTAVYCAGKPVWVYAVSGWDAEGLRSFFISFIQAVIQEPFQMNAAYTDETSLEEVPFVGLVSEKRAVAAVCAQAYQEKYGVDYLFNKLTAYYLPVENWDKPLLITENVRLHAEKNTPSDGTGQYDNDINCTPGVLRRARKDEIPLIQQWISAFYREALRVAPPVFDKSITPSAEETSKSITHPAFRQTAAASLTESEYIDLYVWDDNGPSAMGMINAESHGMRRLNLIYTPEYKRRRGYARQLVYLLCKEITEKNNVPILYTAANNTAANRLYRSLGFKEAGWLTEVLFR
jgi:hypothetical protein